MVSSFHSMAVPILTKQVTGHQTLRVSSQLKRAAARLTWPELNAHFGTPQDLLDLSMALHSRGMYLMVDVVGHFKGTLEHGLIQTGRKSRWCFLQCRVSTRKTVRSVRLGRRLSPFCVS